MTPHERIAIYTSTRMVCNAAEVQINQFIETIGVKRELKQALSLAVKANAAVRLALDKSEYLTLQEKRTLTKEGSATSAAFLELIQNMSLIPDALIDHFLENIAEVAELYTSKNKTT